MRPTNLLKNRIKNHPIRSFADPRTGAVWFCANDVTAFICATAPRTAKHYWHWLKKKDPRFDLANCRQHAVSFPCADGQFRMCDVIDRKTLLYLLRTVTHRGAQVFREVLAGLGVLWLVSRLSQNCRVLAEWIIGKARERGRGMQLSWRQVAWEFVVGDVKGSPPRFQKLPLLDYPTTANLRLKRGAISSGGLLKFWGLGCADGGVV